MDKIIVDPATAQKLRQVQCSARLTDQDGNVIGDFFAMSPAPKEPPITEEEIQRRIQKGGGRKLADILADLEKRA
jgi:hypothetical protein